MKEMALNPINLFHRINIIFECFLCAEFYIRSSKLLAKTWVILSFLWMNNWTLFIIIMEIPVFVEHKLCAMAHVATE
jgi:hypothetical protein